VVVVAVLDVSGIPGVVELAVIVDVDDVVSIVAADVSVAALFFLEHPPNAAPTTTSIAIAPSFLEIRCTLPPSFSGAAQISDESSRRRLGARHPGGNKSAESRLSRASSVASATNRA